MNYLKVNFLREQTLLSLSDRHSTALKGQQTNLVAPSGYMWYLLFGRKDAAVARRL